MVHDEMHRKVAVVARLLLFLHVLLSSTVVVVVTSFTSASHAPPEKQQRRLLPPLRRPRCQLPALFSVRFLGQGEHAIVRPGVVLVAPAHEYHHFYRQSAIFIHAMGQDDSSGDYLIRGLILDHPTPFTLKEMIPQERIQGNPLGDNLLFRGGDKGGEGVILIHNHKEFGLPEIGTSSGLYQGGWDAALAASANGEADVNDFKVFFNYCEFTEQEIEDLFQSKEDDGDCWASVEIDSDLVLSEEWDRGDCWKSIRNAISEFRLG
jgi:hypothetical protein